VTAVTAPANPTGSTYIPRYAGTQCSVGPATIATIATGQTFLLMTYAVNIGGYDTGIAVANTTADPLLATLTAADQNGTLTFNFYPQASTATPAPVAFSYTTSATSPGSGLISGVLNAGGTYTVTLSDLLTAAAQTAAGSTKDTFQGYIIVTCNFTNGHGQYFVYVPSTLASMGTGMMNVLNPPRGTVPEALGQ